MKIEVDGCPFCSASRKQKARTHSSGEAECHAAASASETLLIREVLLFTGLEARGICRREGVGIIRHSSTKVLWLQQLMKRGVVMVGACTSAQNRASIHAQKIPSSPVISRLAAAARSHLHCPAKMITYRFSEGLFTDLGNNYRLPFLPWVQFWSQVKITGTVFSLGVLF